MHFRSCAFHALGGPCSLQLHADSDAKLDAAVAAGKAEAERIESKFSRYRPDSLLSRINAAAGTEQVFEVDAETAGLLDYAAAAHAQSGGLFDATSGVLRRAWDFRAARLPSVQTLEALLPLVGWHQVEWRRPHFRLPRGGMELDFGGFGKEYAVDRVAAVLRGQGIRHGLVEFGGDLCVLGAHPDGSPWRVGIRHPRGPDRAITVLEVVSGALASSGDYERYFERDGRRYSHILDPRSGWPVHGPASVSVLAAQCLVAGTATTVAMLKAADAAPWLEELGLPWLLVSADGRMRGSLQPQKQEKRPTASEVLMS